MHISLLFKFTSKEKSCFHLVEMFYESEYFCCIRIFKVNNCMFEIFSFFVLPYGLSRDHRILINYNQEQLFLVFPKSATLNFSYYNPSVTIKHKEKNQASRLSLFIHWRSNGFKNSF